MLHILLSLLLCCSLNLFSMTQEKTDSKTTKTETSDTSDSSSSTESSSDNNDYSSYNSDVVVKSKVESEEHSDVETIRDFFEEYNLILEKNTSSSEIFTLEAATTNEEKTLDSHDKTAEVLFKAPPSDNATLPIVVSPDIVLHHELRDFGRTSAARANNEFEIKRYIQIYNELNEDQQKACALANKHIHEIAMRMVEYENRPPFGTRIKETFKEIGTGIHKTFDAWFGKKTIEEIVESDQAKKVLEEAKECAIKQEDVVDLEVATTIVSAPSNLSSSNHFEQPTFDLFSREHHAQIIASIIGDPTTSKEIVNLFERTLALQNNSNVKEHADLSELSINLLVYSHIIEKTLSDKNILLKENEINHFEKLKATALEVATNICDYLTIPLEEFTNKLTEEHDSLVFLAQHPVESLKISTQFLGNVGLTIAEFFFALESFRDDEFFGYISPHDLDAIEESSRKYAHVIEQIEKSVADFTEMPAKEQFRSLTKVTIDLATLHLISKSCSLLQAQLRTNALQLNALESVMLVSEQSALLKSTQEMIFKEQQLVNSIEKITQYNLAIASKEAIKAEQKELAKLAILETSKEFAQSKKGLEIMARLERKSALNFIELHKDLTNFAHLYRKETVIEAMKILELTAEKLQLISNQEELQKTIKAIQKTTKDIAKLNSNLEWERLKYTGNNEVTKESIHNALQTIKAKESAMALETIKELQATQGQTSIWHKIEPTEGMMPETLIPRSFTIDVEGTKLWIHPNATKHLEEFIASPNLMNEFLGSAILPAEQTLQAQELMLIDFYATIKEIIKDGIPTTERAIELNGWEISIGPSKKAGNHPIIFHAIRNYK